MFDFISGFIDSVGAVGVALLMFLENVFPPIPSELIMPLAGYNAAAGRMSLIVVLIAGSIGSLAGAALWYWIGAKIGPDRLRRLASRHGRWLTLDAEDFDRARAWFDRHGRGAVLIGRLVPTIRTFISVPAGISGMPFWNFMLYSAVGTVVWTAFLTLAGYFLRSQYTLVEQWLNPVTTVVVVAIVAVYLYRVITFSPSALAGTEAEDRQHGTD